MKLLFIDHECHAKTHSADFFLDILRREFSVTSCCYKKTYRTGSASPMRTCDTAVIWEFPISRRNFFFREKRNVFVPMYDNEWASFWQWKRIAWSGMGVVSFCGKVAEHARKCGVRNILDVRYFPAPESLPQASGDPGRVFLWERGDIGLAVAQTLFPPSEGYAFDVKRSGDVMERGAYLKRVAKCGIVVAPRRKEGIGMAFLEAMAMGKCVVANDDATMNEYVRSGENGILFDAAAPRAISAASVERARANVIGSAARFRRRWLADAERINRFIAAQKPCQPSLVNRIKIALAYPLYLLEGAWHVLSERSSTIKSGSYPLIPAGPLSPDGLPRQNGPLSQAGALSPGGRTAFGRTRQDQI